jgi:beta-lactamase regulating signal transducer with metallopeptidase domain
MIAWLTDTFIYTALLIALVLVLRRPVARHFGPHTAYALWALPLLRFAMPPIVLPASFAPEQPGPVIVMVTVRAARATASAAPAAETASVPWAAIVLSAWVFGALAFLGWRCWGYFRMRKELLAGSRPVGEAGKVRLVETPALASPVAFGVLDKVVALPPEFMALEDRTARDLAIEHELAHHRGWDLLANMLAQPLLALHWFNPLAWLGWRAMRRDQEAACDARVIARRTPAERAHYAQVIASFAAGPRLALAAPMACPMAGRFRGEKSIIHRLRSLNMTDISPRRRLAGRVLWIGAALALPLTASVSYAVAPAPEAPEAPPASGAPAAAAAPTAPDAPPAAGEHKYIWRAYGGPKGDKVVTMTVRNVGPGEVPKDADGNPLPTRGFALAPVPPVPPVPPMPPAPMSEEQQQRFAEMGKQFADQGEQWAQWGEQFGRQFGPEWSKEWQKRSQEWAKEAQKRAEEWQKKWKDAPQTFAFTAPNVQVHCPGSGGAVANDGRGGAQTFVLCRQHGHDTARRALERAKASIANDRGLPPDARNEAIRSLDEEIGRLDEDDSDTDN